jgi:DNA-binding GntR family transcriptional regulator
VLRADEDRPVAIGPVGSVVDEGELTDVETNSSSDSIGTRVVQPKVRRPLELSSLFDDLAKTGQAPATKVLRLTAVEREEEMADRLGVPVGTEVQQLVRLRSAVGKPIAKMTNFLPERAESSPWKTWRRTGSTP